MAAKVKLNKTTLAKLEPVDGKQTVFWDSELPGFGVRVSNGRLVDGVREYGYSFFCQGRLRGRVIKVTIGKAPTFSPDMARRTAREYLGKMGGGQDPRKGKGPGKGSGKFGEMMVGYAGWMEPGGKISAAKVKREIEKDIRDPFKP